MGGIPGWLKAAILVLLLLSGIRAWASEGYVSLYYSVEGVGESSFTLSHCVGASEGLDDDDTIWYFIACVSCKTDTKAVSSVEGEDLKIDSRPIHSESGATVRCSVVSKTGDSISVDNASQWVDIYVGGLEGYDVYVNGVNAREVGRIDFSPLTGSYSSGSTIETVEISLSKQPGYEPDDPPQFDPNGVEEPGSNEPAIDALLVANQIEGCPQDRTGVWMLKHAQDARDGIDANDVPYARPDVTGFTSLVVSMVVDRSADLGYLLAVDARPPGGQSDVEIGVGVDSDSRQPVHFASPAANNLVFSFPPGKEECFGERPLTFQRYDRMNPGLTYPIWDIRKLVERNQGLMPLEDLAGYRTSGIPYVWARVSTNRRLGDVLRDGVIDANDYDLVAAQQGFQGPTGADIGSAAGLGLPDGTVDAWDLYFLYEAMNDSEKGKMARPALPVTIEGFETGVLDGVNWHSPQWSGWSVTSEDHHAGLHSARAGGIADGEISSLTLTANCMAGQIRFWRRVSCESNWDVYRFFMDGELRESLSGEVPWAEAIFAVPAGIHAFTWEYEKDGSTSRGDDTVYVDDVSFPAIP